MNFNKNSLAEQLTDTMTAILTAEDWHASLSSPTLHNYEADRKAVAHLTIKNLDFNVPGMPTNHANVMIEVFFSDVEFDEQGSVIDGGDAYSTCWGEDGRNWRWFVKHTEQGDPERLIDFDDDYNNGIESNSFDRWLGDKVLNKVFENIGKNRMNKIAKLALLDHQNY